MYHKEKNFPNAKYSFGKIFSSQQWRLFPAMTLSFGVISKKFLSVARARSRAPSWQPEMTPQDNDIVGDEEKLLPRSMSTGKILTCILNHAIFWWMPHQCPLCANSAYFCFQSLYPNVPRQRISDPGRTIFCLCPPSCSHPSCNPDGSRLKVRKTFSLGIAR